MTKYIIIDSEQLGNDVKAKLGSTETVLIDSSEKSVLAISHLVAQKIDSDNSIVVLLNADAKTKDSNEKILDIMLWLRCKYDSFNPIVTYGMYSLVSSLQKKAGNYFIVSPGCVYIEDADVLNSTEDIKQLKPIADLKDINPFIKPKVDELITTYKHRMANYAAMALMLLVAKGKYGVKSLPNMLPADKGYNYEGFMNFLQSLDYYLLKHYFNLNYQDDPSKHYNSNSPNKKILLIDDLANEGWRTVLSWMLYGKKEAREITSLTIQRNADKTVNEKDTEKELAVQIKTQKPHLILLDLRLNDESGKVDPKELSGFKLLKFIKGNPDYKGIPVIMFTASGNANTVKKLLTAGAFAVWTKPGIDEGLNAEEIINRYQQLQKLKDGGFNWLQKSIPDLNGDGNVIRYNEIRNNALQYFGYIKYRCSLYTPDELGKLVPRQLKNSKFIYFDTNALITGTNTIDFTDLIKGFYLISQLTHKTVKNKDIKARETDEKFIPATVVMNEVYDEVIKKFKVGTSQSNPAPRLRLRASITLDVLNELLTEKKIRTQIYGWNQTTQEFIYSLKNPKENVYADGFIMDELAGILTTKEGGIDYRNKFAYNDQLQVTFVTEEKSLTKKLEAYKNKHLKITKLNNFIDMMKSVII